MKPEHKIALLCNPLAGTGSAVTVASCIEMQLSELGVPYTAFYRQWPESFEEFTDVWLSGGDGTLHFFINRYRENKLPLAIFKGGTGNDTHWLLYGNRTVQDQVLHVLASGPRYVDAGRCNQRYFINGAGIGFEGAVVRSLSGKKKRPGKASFLLTILKKIFRYHSRQYSISSEEYAASGKWLIVDVVNGQRAGGGFHISPASAIDDGWLDVVLASRIHPLKRLRFLPLIEKGRHLQLSCIRYFQTRKISIDSPTELEYHLDGEYYSALRAEIEIVPAKFLFRY